jgi:hypothetical protein
MTRPSLYTFGVLAAIILAGCGGGKPTETTASAAETPSKAPTAKPAAVKVSRDNPCSVMFPTEVAEIFGAKGRMREVMDEVTCRYHIEPDAQAKKSSGGETFVEVKIHWKDGRMAVTATRLAGRLLGGASSGFEKLPGIGDEAWLAPMASYLAFSKGDVGVEIDMRLVPSDKEKAVRLGKLIASRI